VAIITATPYSGDPAAFSSMVTLGANGGGDLLMFRRSRDEVGDERARRHRFALVRVTGAEARLQRLLARYTRDVWRHAPENVDAARLAMTVLRKRALSAPAALLRSLTRRAELLRGTMPAPRQLSLFADAAEADDDLADEALAVPGLADAGIEARWLATLIEAARRAAAPDSKLRYLLRLMRRAPHESIVVFTEYRDTLRHLADALPGALQLHGGLSVAERGDVQRRFNEAGGILLATDAAAEGLNLQKRCRLVVNYELPWNPARLEQRIGRVDRIGQGRRVHAISFVARDTAEDLVVAALARRLRRVATTLGERDRLAAFLTDARTARAVIGGESAEIDHAPPAPPLPRAAADRFDAARAAGQIGGASQTTPEITCVPTAVTRARGTAPGCYVVVRAAAAHDERAVAERSIVVHIDAAQVFSTGGENDPHAVARRAGAVVERHGGSIDTLRTWFAAVEKAHHEATEARIARERAIAATASRQRDLQPGLFDRRALDESVRAADADSRRSQDHEQHVRRLESAGRLRLETSAAAVLIVWR
jgi:hypothetical protein